MKKTKNTSKPKSSVKHAVPPETKNHNVAIVLAICLVLIVVGAYSFKSTNKKSMTDNKAPAKISANEWLQGLLLSGNTITVPGVTPAMEIALQQKTTEFGDEENNNPDTMRQGTVTIGDILTGDQEHIFTTLAINTGGSGEFFYLVAFDSTDMGYKMTSSVPLDDRIVIEILSVEGDVVSISYRTHGPDQAMVDNPNVQVEKKFKYMDGTLSEL